MRRKLIISSGFLFATVLIGSLWLHCHDILSYRNQPSYYRSDQPYVDRAVNMWSTKVQIAPVQAMENRYPVTVHLNEITCVELRLKVGSVGGNPTYCFNDKTFSTISRYDDVE